jgi:hypothetical protein
MLQGKPNMHEILGGVWRDNWDSKLYYKVLTKVWRLKIERGYLNRGSKAFVSNGQKSL